MNNIPRQANSNSAAKVQLVDVDDFKAAIDKDEIEVYLQPKVNFSSSVIESCEALARWAHPKHGIILPACFVELAERTGMMSDLTHAVLRKALKCLQEIQEEIPVFSISVNISASSLTDTRLVDQILQLLKEYRIQPNTLELEITGSTAFDNPEAAASALMLLHNEGVKTCIDDFGCGHSSLAILKKLPVHCLNLDRFFVTNMCSDEDNYNFVKSTIALAASLGMQCVAEGVEDEQTFLTLKAMGCHSVQGYFIGKPIPSADVGRVIETFMLYSARALMAKQIKGENSQLPDPNA